MSADRMFVDTNILLYAHDRQEGLKRQRAQAILRDLWQQDSGALSLQVLQEFVANSARVLGEATARARVREIVSLYRAWVRQPTTPDTVLRAADIAELAKVSFWDAMIIAAAEAAAVRTLLTEDLNHGQIIAGVRIENPFLAA
ncbi:MAG: PIN domain-containing protein [Betaproteobacteria bacterium]|nr:PIN domain-containing protein [Betaproteobacteria bacterium]